MTDRLLSFVQHPLGRRVARALGLPQPVPLLRRHDAWRDQELAGRLLSVIAPGSAAPMPSLLTAIAAQGGTAAGDAPASALVIDATGCRDVAALQALFMQAQFGVSRLAPGGRVLALSSSGAASAAEAACLQAVSGFIRALAKEIGRRGATANALVLGEGAASAESLAGALRFFATDRSAYVSGQVLAWRKEAAPAPDRPQPVALVTGAAGGIGAATARRLARDGLRVLCVDVPAARQPLEAVAREIDGPLLAADLTAAGTVDELVDAVRRVGGVDVLVHNAGITRDRTLARMSTAEWDAVMAVNLAAILAIDARLDEAGLLNAGVREVCLSSISGIAGNAGQTNYSASKAALIGYVAARAAPLAERAGTINAVAPGFIETAMTRRMPLMVREAGRRLNALKQGGTPADVAEAIAFLASPAAHPLTGQVLRVCGQSLLGA
ncbi:3-oxoacyl-ACP reductase [Mitsuaria sp. BK037]|uniref:3-oxoacyl-ACP reductase n=1 Tax=Mitsuaria sp. BK037 TaxID=2587122 RepID=UPI00161BD963|nr:3-oxoacyl-ACP reductase [Mitsuaria sp. BK037]MBB3281445.1 3-oxoacyl-[acyl-carrier protein] reductase [Mitsuaria sp. BK037]